jgi:hypothetical protein
MVSSPKTLFALVLSSSACIWLVHAKVPIWLVVVPAPSGFTVLAKREPGEESGSILPGDSDHLV